MNLLKNLSGKKMPILPVEAYYSQEWFDLEQKHIFGNTWQFAGFTEDVKDPGDYITTQCGLTNILIVKGSDQELRAFHNICRHRGTQLLRAVGKQQKAITCPYHDWTYNLTGELVSVPEKESQFPDLNLKKMCLHKAAVKIWRGMVFVHPDPAAEPLESWLEGVEEKLGPHKPETLVEYEDTRSEHIISANWKIVAENYMDGYHLAHLHANTLNMYEHSKQVTGFTGPHFTFWEPLSQFYFDNLDKLIPYKRIPGMTDDIVGAYVPLLFPNLGLTESESTWSIFHIIPEGPEKTKVIIRSKVVPMTAWEYTTHSTRSNSAWKKIMQKQGKYEEGIAGDPMSSGDFMAEDIFACEQAQKSLRSPLFSIGATAKDLEASVREFQTIVQTFLETAVKQDEKPLPAPEAETPKPKEEDEITGVDFAQVQVSLRGEEFEVVVPKGRTILEGLKFGEHNPPYSCESGVCGSCKTKLIKGKVAMKKCFALDEQEVEAGWILTCQSLPQTEKVEIKYEA